MATIPAALLIDGIVDSFSDSKKKSPSWSPGIAAAVAHIRDQLTTTPMVADMARVAAMSTSHFHGQFRKEVGLTPAQFHLQHRITHARRLLDQERQRSINDIAKACGFVNSKHFATSFKRFTGVSPRVFRQQLQ